MVWEEFHCANDSCCPCPRNGNFIASVVLCRHPDIPSVEAVRRPSATFVWCFVHENFGARGSHGHAVVIVEAVEVSVRGDFVVDATWSQHVECALCLWDKFILKVERKIVVCASDFCNKVILKCLY